ncbi:MAG: UDP-3-O-(3-hydroxymyristoyl)glucosamine N-acyltransferase [Candidatus Rokubacteria bacterium]|nr:UDP-3-O-(3-hydroxymyristoyl)glucosamine N-acyltransferase [Candidatus Rokubacteria bacterium]
MTRFTLGQLAEALDAKLDGDATRVVTGLAPLDAASASDISFLTDPRYESAARASHAGAFVAPIGTRGLPGPVLECASPQRALIDLLTLFFPEPAPAAGVDPSALVATDALVDPSASIGPLAVVDPGARVGARVRVHALAYVGCGVEIGEDSVVHPHVVLRQGVRLGRRVIVHAGAVLGADGFGYARDGARHRKIPQVGGVIVEDDVEIGANTTVDRGTLGATIVRRGAKIDNLVQVAHNVEVGEDAIIAAQTGIAGSSRVGRGAIVGGQVGIGDHITIGEGAMLGAQSGYAQDVPPGAKLTGTWGRPIMQARRIWVAQAELPDMVIRIKKLEQRLAELEARLPRDRRA